MRVADNWRRDSKKLQGYAGARPYAFTLPGRFDIWQPSAIGAKVDNRCEGQVHPTMRPYHE